MTGTATGGPFVTWPGRPPLAAAATERGTEPASGPGDGVVIEPHELIVGDNLEVLRLLARRGPHVSVVYIDPPYNTGKRFVYRDGGRRAEARSAWLDDLHPRLVAARTLLRGDGMLAVSIGDEEHATLRLLLEEVFGAENHVATFVVQRSEGGGLATHVVTGHDYLVVFARHKPSFPPLRRAKDIRGPVVEHEGEEYWIEDDWLRREFGPYALCEYGEVAEIHGEARAAEIEEGLRAGRYRLVHRRDGRVLVGRLRRVADDSSKLYSILRHLNRDARRDLEEIGMPTVFDYPKPVSLVADLIRAATFRSAHTGAVVLDFYAGSGTTGHAVLRLNSEDGGDRRYVLVQSDEPIRGRSARARAGRDLCKEIGAPPTIAALTQERLRRARIRVPGDRRPLRVRRLDELRGGDDANAVSYSDPHGPGVGAPPTVVPPTDT